MSILKLGSSFTVCPFTIVVDSSEQIPFGFEEIYAAETNDDGQVVVGNPDQGPFGFTEIPARKVDGGGLVVIRTIVKSLRSGDYSIDGWEGRVSVERKSLADLYGTLGRGRERFEREIDRLAEMEYAAIVVEKGWQAVVDPDGDDPIWYSKLKPRSVWGTVFAWTQRYPTIDWFFMDSRWLAEFATFEILERFWRDHTTG